jgi:hypothetical protein
MVPSFTKEGIADPIGAYPAKLFTILFDCCWKGICEPGICWFIGCSFCC